MPPAITTLFASAGPQAEVMTFSWRLIRRKNNPFLLLPEHSDRTTDHLELYTAQRRLAKMSRSTLPLLLRTPAGKLFERVTIRTDTNSDFMRFLAEQAGVPPGELEAPAIKFGGVVGRTSRVVLLLCDAGGHPIRVIKAGLNPAGRAATEREADLLTRLPVGMIGCTGISGRFTSSTMSAFATTFFSGASLDNDVGIETLFHAWLTDTPPEPIEHLASWRELESIANSADIAEWPALRNALVGLPVRPTLYHGDFAPWNVRMTNLENIRAFDWESGHLKGIPAWDWFHFIVQTSILVKRHSRERAAAELEQLIQSPRFQNYARRAGISEVIEPLLLAYLLHHRLVTQPLEGRRRSERLFQWLWRHWQMRLYPGQPLPGAEAGLTLSAKEQIANAFVKVVNLFWEPRLSPVIRLPLGAQLRRHWLALLLSLSWIGGVAVLHFFCDRHLLLTPFYLVPCVWLVLKADRRLGVMAAFAAAITGPLLHYIKYPQLFPLKVICENMVMRLLLFYSIVILLDNVRKNRARQPRSLSELKENHSLAGNWAVMLITGLYLALVMVLDAITNPNYLFVPLYLLPCVVFTLTIDWRWGTVAALVGAIAGPVTQSFEDPGYQPWDVEFWNTLMLFVIFEMVVVLLKRIRQDSVLFRELKK